MKLSIKNLSVAYEKDPVLHNVDLAVSEGEFVSLLGPSGCGKTTLLKTVAGILPAKTGSIQVDGTDITRLPVHKRGTVVMFQDIRLFPHMSVAENVAFPLKMQGVAKAERLERALEYLRKVQMKDFADRRSGDLSGGQQQRVALARALAAQPRILLLDEPFSALDENLREDMRALVLSLKRELGITVILVTHDREEALSMSDRVALMFGGKLVQLDTPQAVYSHPATLQVANYFGGWIHIPGQVKNGIFTNAAVILPIDAPDGKGELLLRPEDLVLCADGNYSVTVQESRFRGHDRLMTLLGEDGTVWKRSFHTESGIFPGQSLRAKLSSSDALFFPKEHSE